MEVIHSAALAADAARAAEADLDVVILSGLSYSFAAVAADANI